MTNRRPNLTIFLLAGFLLAAFGLRLFRLDYQSLWWDEGISLHLATSSLADIIGDRLDNIHPPLYFFLLKGWLALTGISPFTGRYLSALASLTQVALVFAAARHWSGSNRRAALPWIAATLMLLSPLSVIYGQEIRVYALLPVVYIAALLLAEHLVTADKMAVRSLFFLAVVEWLGLHLHYIAIFGVAYIAAWGLLAFVRRRDTSGARRWVVTHIFVVVASLPWLLAVLNNWTAVRAEASAGTFTTDPVPLPFLFSQVWAFHLTGLAGSLASGFVQVTAVLAALLALGLILFHTVRSRYRRPWSAVPLLTAHWLVPLLSGLFVWSVRSFSHPRYIVMFAAMLVPLIAFLIYPARRWAARAAAVALAVCVLSLSFWGLSRYFFATDVAKPDVRGVASHLETVAAAGDVVFIPDTDWSLPFEYDGEAAVLMPHISDSPHDPDSILARVLDCAGERPCAESGRVFTLDYPRGGRDWQERLPFELERRGHWLDVTAFSDVDLREYHLAQRPGPLPACDSPDIASPGVSFDALRLESAWIEQGAASDTAVAVALCWRSSQAATAAYTASLVMRDPLTGERVSQADMPLLNSAGATTDRWLPGETVVTYHLLPLPPGTPPVEMDLALGVYRSDDASLGTPPVLLEGVDERENPAGQLVPLGAVTLAAPFGLGPTPYEVAQPPLWDVPVELAGGLQLAGARLGPGPYRPGQTIRVGLTWRATHDSLPDLRPSLRLEQDGRVLAENADAPANGRYPTGHWRRGEMVYEVRDVRVPAGVEGPVQLSISVEGGRVERLGEVAISGAAVLFDRPPVPNAADVHFEHGIALVGFDAPAETITTADIATITLVWQSNSGDIPAGYTVFVHMLSADGSIVAQHDSPPANGLRPTDEWLAGEFIIDSHELIWRDPAYSGEAQIAVGLYDPASGRRLMTLDGADSYRLPLAIRVETAP